MTDTGATIEFRNVRKEFGTFTALDNFCLEVGASEFMTLLGPSGSGKTTALNTLAGFIDADKGDILIDGVSIRHTPTEKRNIGMVFQSYSLFPHRNVLANVSFPLQMRKIDKAEVRQRSMKALEMVQLADLAQRMPHELSGGQKQRVAIARALVFEPRVLLMDEPLGALDLKLRETLQLELKALQKQIGSTVIFVTHDQGEALTLSDRIAVMDNGEIQQICTPQELYDQPVSTFIANFIGSNNILKVGAADQHSIQVEGLGRIPLKPGTAKPYAVGLRPELIRRTATDGVPAVVEQTIFSGEAIRYITRTADGTEILLVEPRHPGEAPLAAGQSIALGFDFENLNFLAK